MSNTGLHGLIIDCQADDIDGVAKFWSEALRLPLNPTAYPAIPAGCTWISKPRMWRRRSRDCRGLAL